MKSTSQTILLSLLAIPFILSAQEKKSSEGFKTSTVSDFLASKYKWEEVKDEPASSGERNNDTPIKPVDQKKADQEAEIEARLQPTLRKMSWDSIP